MHALDYLTFTTRKSTKTIQRECDKITIQNGDYHHACDPIRFHDIVCKNYNEAFNWIEAHDKRWYDCLAVKYRDGRAVKWLVKIEYHC